VLSSSVQGDRLPRFHTIEGDKVTGRLAGDTFTGRPQLRLCTIDPTSRSTYNARSRLGPVERIAMSVVASPAAGP